ncbi:DsbA family protein [Isoptericola croceus]|uniref:DsbA family protein n=1 Tax=Isoptericola croceus TaxID=3031406 RepID=UPI0023F75815|nr:thioredoxin domain-containing protein [Isoptericola croceus]
MSNKNKAQLREEARLEALARQQKQAQRDRRNRFLVFGGLGVAIIALVAVAAFILINEGAKKNVEDIPLAEVSDVPSTATESGGIPVGSDLVAGTENEGAPVVDEYLDYMCPACGQFTQTNGADVEALLTSGDATVVYYPVSILDRSSRGSDYSTRAAAAAYWLADQAPEAFYEFNKAVFANQPEQNTTGLDDDELAELAESVGAPADVAGGIADGTARATYGQYVYSLSNEVTADESLFNANGSFGTPTVLIDGQRFEAWGEPGALLAAVQGDEAVLEEEPAEG